MTRIQQSYHQLRTVLGYNKSRARHTVEQMVKAHVLGVSADVTKTNTWRPRGVNKSEVLK